MKIFHFLFSTVLAATVSTSLCLPARAAIRADQFFFQDGQVWAVDAGRLVLLEEEVTLPNGILVSTNGTFKVGDHTPRAFLDGQTLDRDGMLTSANGRIDPVVDHVTLDAGRTFSSVNGQRINVQQNIPLGPDKRLTPDRVLLGGERGWMRVIDGQLFTPNGKVIPAIDTISLQHGRVIVQKDGGQLSIPPGRTIMMNEGTKVFGEGKVLSPDGRVTQLREGQIMTIEGVVKLR